MRGGARGARAGEDPAEGHAREALERARCEPTPRDRFRAFAGILLQSTQNRDTKAINIKRDETLRASRGARSPAAPANDAVKLQQ